MFVPDIAKVREKMLYASSRDALKRDLGYTSFSSELHACDMDEVSYERYQQQTLVSDADRLSLMSEKERMLAKVRVPESCDRSGQQASRSLDVRA
jgi:twinfilin-like protein